MKHYLTIFITFSILSLTSQFSYAENYNDEPEIQEFGLVTSIEDGTYPMFSVTIEFPERGFAEIFSLNVEAMPFDTEYLRQAIGKYVSFFYTSTLQNSLLELESKGNFLLGEGAIHDDWLRHEGTLRNANSATMGDLPDVVTIVDATGTSHNFSVYITPEMAQANGQWVTAYFATFTKNNITKLEINTN